MAGTRENLVDYQVGGSHYKSAYPHWDWAEDIGLSYLEGYATKYLARYNKPGTDPLKDMGKVVHILRKIQEQAPRLIFRRRVLNLPEQWVISRTDLFCSENNIQDPVARIIRDVAYWQTEATIERARHSAAWLQLENMPKTAAAVPLEDSNKHGLQSGDDDANPKS
jgi:hypothetical protein